MAKIALIDTMQRFSGERCICRISVAFRFVRCIDPAWTCSRGLWILFLDVYEAIGIDLVLSMLLSGASLLLVRAEILRAVYRTVFHDLLIDLQHGQILVPHLLGHDTLRGQVGEQPAVQLSKEHPCYSGVFLRFCTNYTLSWQAEATQIAPDSLLTLSSQIW